ncbi:hypothetical protein COLO4_20502 [Corchorus olitorius]|uniref:Uncharacterized protein n=1 Tax=Corchorus olitorius TaxID=93759 RepID=A0A1R3IZM3_9ROSI|nr:hypothetical protein COLO4_20502 [Corchorus olitorius]
MAKQHDYNTKKTYKGLKPLTMIGYKKGKQVATNKRRRDEKKDFKQINANSLAIELILTLYA